MDRSLNETVPDKLRKYHTDYDNNPPILVFLQNHRETDQFFAASGFQFTQHDRGLFLFHHTDNHISVLSQEGVGRLNK